METTGMAMTGPVVGRRTRVFYERFSMDDETGVWSTLGERTTFCFLIMGANNESSPLLDRERPTREIDMHPSMPYFEVKNGKLFLHTFAYPAQETDQWRSFRPKENVTWKEFNSLPRSKTPTGITAVFVTIPIGEEDSITSIFSSIMQDGYYDWL